MPYDDWNKLDEEEDEELQDNSVRALSHSPVATNLTNHSSSREITM
jgi:hypothetical protein